MRRVQAQRRVQMQRRVQATGFHLHAPIWMDLWQGKKGGEVGRGRVGWLEVEGWGEVGNFKRNKSATTVRRIQQLAAAEKHSLVMRYETMTPCGGARRHGACTRTRLLPSQTQSGVGRVVE